ncbi:MAG: AAA family ATPase, partial [Chloroflexota bacterium]|nr:AAA family ATPase [Chloroflexota bacterium]
MRQLYLAATGMNRGKTTVSLGLLAALIDRGLDTGFIKPVGQRYAVVDGVPADEDAILMRTVFGMPDPLTVMSPVHIPRGFTKSYISGDVTEDLPSRIRHAHDEAARGRDVLLIEGTGHAGVGAVIDLSNADVARMLGAPVVIVSGAGVGRPIDEIVLNHALFAARGVEVVGAVINKVDADAHPSLPGVLRAGLARHDIELLGMLPYRPLLSNPTLSMLVEQMPGEVLHPGADLDRVIDHVAIGAMQPRHLLERIGPGSLLIVPGDREDVIQATVAANRTARSLRSDPGLFDRLRNRSRFGRRADDPARTELAGMLFTGGYRPRPRDLEAIKSEDLFAYLVEPDTYAAASRVHDLLVKIHAADTAKIALIKALVAEHLDVDRLLEAFQRPADRMVERASRA